MDANCRPCTPTTRPKQLAETLTKVLRNPLPIRPRVCRGVHLVGFVSTRTSADAQEANMLDRIHVSHESPGQRDARMVEEQEVMPADLMYVRQLVA